MKALQQFFALFLLALSLPLMVAAQGGGTLDATFGTNGRAFAPFPLGSGGYGGRVVLHADGRIGVVATSDDAYFAAQFLSDGTLDSSFGAAGVAAGTPDAIFYEDLTCVLALPSGKTLIVINFYGGTEDGTKIIQLDAAGMLDASFGQGGVLKLDLSPGDAEEYLVAGTVLPNGKILLAGYAENAQLDLFTGVVICLNPDGSYNTAFNGTGRYNAPLLLGFSGFTAISVQPDGKIILGGLILDLLAQSQIGLTLRLNATGTTDITYGTGGAVLLNMASDKISFITDMIRTPDGKLLVCGTTDDFDAPRVARLNANGSLDNTFGTNGVSIVTSTNLLDFDEPRLTLLNDQRIAVCAPGIFENNGGFEDGYLLAVFNSSGSLDSSFGDGGIVTALDEQYGVSVAVQADGKILVGGRLNDSGLFVHRYNEGTGVYTKDMRLDLSNVQVFPNPVRSNATLRFHLPENKQLQVDLIDGVGRLCAVLAPMRSWDAGPNALPLQFPSLSAGNYRVRVTDEAGRMLTVHVVVQ